MASSTRWNELMLQTSSSPTSNCYFGKENLSGFQRSQLISTGTKWHQTSPGSATSLISTCVQLAPANLPWVCPTHPPLGLPTERLLLLPVPQRATQGIAQAPPRTAHDQPEIQVLQTLGRRLGRLGRRLGRLGGRLGLGHGDGAQALPLESPERLGVPH